MASVTANKAPTTAASTTTAEDTLKRKTRAADVVSGGHLVAKALKSEGVDTIFTLCGGHIIDIYDGCIDEGIRIIDISDPTAPVFVKGVATDCGSHTHTRSRWQSLDCHLRSWAREAARRGFQCPRP